jgi:quercetin dioxygenase-like cupin family protein
MEEEGRAISAFDDVAAIPPQQVWEQIVARPVHGERLTLAIVELEPGAVVDDHSHDNEQLGIVLLGSMPFRVGDEERELGPGSTWSIPSNVSHSATAGPDGASVIDVFAPVRSDWAALERQDPRPGPWP